MIYLWNVYIYNKNIDCSKTAYNENFTLVMKLWGRSKLKIFYVGKSKPILITLFWEHKVLKFIKIYIKNYKRKN